MTAAFIKLVRIDLKAAFRWAGPAILALLALSIVVLGFFWLRGSEAERPALTASNPTLSAQAGETIAVRASQMGSASDGSTLVITRAETSCGSVSVLASRDALTYVAPSAAQTCAVSYRMRHRDGGEFTGFVAFNVSRPSVAITASNPTRTVAAASLLTLNAPQLGASSNGKALEVVHAEATCGRVTVARGAAYYTAPPTTGSCTLGYTLRDAGGAIGTGAATIIVQD
jgi:hypothetical protein